MLTFFSIPKPFSGYISRLQRNAVRSWRTVCPDAEIILLGDDAGVGEMAAEVGAVHIPKVACTEWGAPRVDDVFRQAENRAQHDLMCYINADIILLTGFMESIRIVVGIPKSFLVIGQRWDLSVEEEINFQDPRWEEGVRKLVRESGQMHSPAAIDYFIFRKGLWPAIPPFGVGRTIWDNWLVLEARRRGAAVVDATGKIQAIHQTHDYSHHAQGFNGVWAGPEAENNVQLAGKPEYNFTIEDTTHVLTKNGVRLDCRPVKIKRHISTLMVLHPATAPAIKRIRGVYKFLIGIRDRLFHRNKG
jgi:hypothetical protein